MLALSSLVLLGPLAGGGTEPALQSPPRPRTVYSVSLHLIWRSVDETDPADEHTGWGLGYDLYNPRSPLGWEVGISRTSDEASLGTAELDTKVTEVYTGGRKTWGTSSFHPYLGAGLAWVEAEAETSGAGSEDDSSFGLYGHGGAYWTFGEHFNLGLDLKAVVGTDIDFGDADYYQVSVVVGYSF